MLEFILVLNGMLIVAMICVIGAAVFALRKVKQGREILVGIQDVHNSLVESVAKIDEKAQSALLTLDHIKLKNPI